jgi:hypothetical protein
VTLFVFFAVLTAGCLRTTAFTCVQDADCGASGTCESVGFCSVPDPDCVGSGRSFSDSAGRGLSGTCVTTGAPGPGADAGVDARTDAPASVGCPSGYDPINGSPHRYKLLAGASWDEAKLMCDRTSTAAYLAVPDDAAELMNLATLATPPFWVGIDDKATDRVYVTQKGVQATFLPWADGQPGTGPQEDCVHAVSATQIATDRCGTRRAAVCECEP